MGIKIIPHDIQKEDFSKWQKALKTTIKSLPKREKEVIPVIHIFEELEEAVYDNLGADNPTAQETINDFKEHGAWAFASLGAAPDFGRISFAVKRGIALKEHVSPEFTIFHEIGHFYLWKNHQVVITKRNKNEVELECDRYGLFSLLRMLHKNPSYKTLSQEKEHITFENSLRKLLEIHIGNKKLTKQKAMKKYEKIVEDVMERMKWENIYKSEAA